MKKTSWEIIPAQFNQCALLMWEKTVRQRIVAWVKNMGNYEIFTGCLKINMVQRRATKNHINIYYFLKSQTRFLCVAFLAFFRGKCHFQGARIILENELE